MEIQTYKDPYFSFAIRQGKPFFDCVGDKDYFKSISIAEKEKIFLKWKYGTHEFKSNKDTEMTDMFLIDRIIKFGLENLTEGVREYWILEIKNLIKSFEIKIEIGLLPRDYNYLRTLRNVILKLEKPVPSNYQDVMDELNDDKEWEE